MEHFDVVDEFSTDRVKVRGRPYLAGSESPDVPETIPMANASVLTLRPKFVQGTPELAAAWCRHAIDTELPASGGILFRGLPLHDRQDFDTFIQTMAYEPCSYTGGIAVRNHTAGFSLMASQEDPQITMAPHNEMAYLPNFPRKAFFFCAEEGTDGGEVPTNDIRESVKLIPEEVLAGFREKGIRYYRNLPRYNDYSQIGWMETFGTDSVEEIERIMEANGYEYSWDTKNRLTYSYCNPAFIEHPATGEELWFNQVTELHSSYWRCHPNFSPDLDDNAYPATTRYGDGTQIDPELITFLRAALWGPAKAVKLRKSDVLVLDNLVIQHGRMSFKGPRKHMVSITQ